VYAVGDVSPGPRDGRRRSNLAQVALLGRALHVVGRLHDRHVQILEVGVDVGEADGGGVLDGAVGLAPALHRRHFRRPPPLAMFLGRCWRRRFPPRRLFFSLRVGVGVAV